MKKIAGLILGLLLAFLLVSCQAYKKVPVSYTHLSRSGVPSLPRPSSNQVSTS